MHPLSLMASEASWQANAEKQKSKETINIDSELQMEKILESGSDKLYLLKLPNGLKACIDERPSRKTVYCEIAARIGSVNEPESLYGISHVLEHLLFKERENNPTATRVQKSGGYLNASTTFDSTSYYFDVGIGEFEDSWKGLSDMVLHPVFSEEDLERERHVVLEEMAMMKSDPMGLASYAILRRMFPDHPLENPIIGFKKTLKKIKRDDVLSYYQKHYVPENMFVIIVGGVDVQRSAQLITESFGQLKPSGAPAAAMPPLPELDIEKSVTIRTLISQSYLIFAAKTEGVKSKDFIATDVLISVLGEGRSSRLYRVLKEEKGITANISVMKQAIADIAGFVFIVGVSRDREEEARSIVKEEIRKIMTEDISEEELQIAKSQIISDFIFGFETNGGISSFREKGLLYGQSLSKDDYIRSIESISKDDIRQVAAKYLNDTRLFEVRIKPARGFGKVMAILRYLVFKRI